MKKDQTPQPDQFDLESLNNVPVKVSIVLGTKSTSIKDLLKLKAGSILELEKKVNDPISMYVNDKKVAMGEIVIIDDKVGVKIQNVVKS